MEQPQGPLHDVPAGSSDGAQPGLPEAAPAGGSKMRVIAIAATAIALLGVSIPFVWQTSADPAATIAADVTPAASHDSTAPADDSGACMANAKPANLNFTFKDLAGKNVALSSFKGKVVLLNFWATWCGPCKAEIPGFVELQAKYGDKLAIIGFSVDDPADKAQAFATQYKINYPVLLGEGNEDLQEAYGPIWGIPASFLISKDGRVCRKHLGIAPTSVFEKEIVALL
jgi:thiol-disulfide isomerase/thioredoxin